MLFDFKIYDKEIIKIKKQYITNTDKYDKCRFYFDKKTWGDKELFVTFLNKSGYSQTVILGKWDDVLSCNVPSYMMEDNYFKIFAYAKDLFKTNTLKVSTRKGNCQINQKKKKATDYLLEKLDTKIDNIIFENNQLKCYSDSNLIDTIYIDNVDEVIVKDIVDNHLEEIQNQLEEKLENCLTNDDLDYLIINL